MLISLVPTALAADRSELEDHWASESLLYFADEGWLQGYKDGTYRPDSKISRAEFLTILNRVCGFTDRDDEAAKRFTDVKKTDWYFEQVSIALAAGYTNGTSATATGGRRISSAASKTVQSKTKTDRPRRSVRLHLS